MTARTQTLDFEWRLQSLRGLAALMVALGHSFTILPHGQAALFGPDFTLARAPATLFSLTFQANAAVIFFYVLSGYVLFLSLRRTGPELSLRSVAAFVAKRAARLYPVVWVTVIAAAIYIGMRYHREFGIATGWYNNGMSVEIDAVTVVSNLTLLDTKINPVLWSIQVELVAAFFIPFAAFLCARTSLAFDAVIIVLLFAMGLPWHPESAQSLIYCFYLGGMLPKVIEPLAGAQPLSVKSLLVSVPLLLVVDAVWRSPLVLPHQWGMHLKFACDALVSAHIIAVVVAHRTDARLGFLDSGPMKSLGRLAYSFYALHFLIMDITAQVSLRILPAAGAEQNALAIGVMGLIALVSTAVAVALAAVLYRWVEEPGIAAGARMSSWIRERNRVVVGTSRPPL